MDTLTGAGLLSLPGWTMRGMGLAVPGSEALEFVRFVGVFVFAVGISYLMGAAQDDRLLFVLSFTRIFRAGAGLFTLTMVVVGGWSPAWLAVSIVDLGLVLMQTWALRPRRRE